MNKICKEEIYEKYSRNIESYVKEKVNNFHDAQDLVNTVFAKIYGNINSFDEKKASLSTWIYTITRNTVIDYYRTKRKFLPLTDAILEDYITEDIISDNALDDLADALLELDERERDLIILHYYSGYTLKKIGVMMSMPYITVKLKHKKALDKLRKMLCKPNK